MSRYLAKRNLLAMIVLPMLRLQKYGVANKGVYVPHYCRMLRLENNANGADACSISFLHRLRLLFGNELFRRVAEKTYFR